ncbi:hypothetical protein [Caudoviricetes sp.]|nr:hypothetical protein [Caudoviricetes sp.]
MSKGRKVSPQIGAEIATLNALPADGNAAHEVVFHGLSHHQASMKAGYWGASAAKAAGDGRKFTRTVTPVADGWLVTIRRAVPRTAKAHDPASWEHIKALPQGEVFKALSVVAKGEPLTHKRLSELAGYHVNRISHWLTAGSAQEPMAETVRHHLWLAVKHGKPI